MLTLFLLQVQELFDWSHQGSINPTVALNELGPNQYGNVICQIVAKAVDTVDVCYLLRVWDGSCIRQ